MFYCPVCKSPDIFPVAGGYMGQVYACKKCKYRGSFVLEIDEADAAPEPETRSDTERNHHRRRHDHA